MKPQMNILAALALCALSCTVMPTAASGAEEAIATDRPDFVESSKVVGKGRIQLETSFALERDARDGNRDRTYTTPTLLRLGVSDSLELRLETDGIVRLRRDDAGVRTSQRGYADASFGLKWHAQDGDEATHRPGIAWLMHVDADTGSRAFRGHGLRPSLRMVAEWELPSGYSVGVMPGVSMERNDIGRRYAAGILAAVVGKTLTERSRGFVELAGQQFASAENGGNLVTLDVGFAYLLTDSVQIDTAVSRGLNNRTPDRGWTLGLSVRF